MTIKLFFAFIFISSLTFAQYFQEKYDISGFLNKTHSMENNRKKFKEFKAHLQKLNFKFDYNFRKEYKQELANYPEALGLFNKYRRKKVSTYFIHGLTGFMIGGVISAINFGDSGYFVIGFATGLVGSLPYTSVLNYFGKKNFIDSLLLYHTEFEKKSINN